MIRVELTKEDPGAIAEGSNGEIEITLPLNAPLAPFMSKLRQHLIGLGYPQE